VVDCRGTIVIPGAQLSLRVPQSRRYRIGVALPTCSLLLNGSIMGLWHSSRYDLAGTIDPVAGTGLVSSS